MSKSFISGHLNDFLNSYEANTPLKLQLRSFYNQRRYLGSRDRKILSDMIFGYFRLNSVLPDLIPEEKAALAMYLSGSDRNEIIQSYSKIRTGDAFLMDVDERISNVRETYPAFEYRKIFPLIDKISPQVDHDRFVKSNLTPGKVWLWIKKGMIDYVLEDLEKNAIIYNKSHNDQQVYSIKNPGRLKETMSYSNGFFEIQDPGSLYIINKLKIEEGCLCWDACCGSGGKSLALLNFAKGKSITIEGSDKRKNVGLAYSSRLQKSGYSNFSFHEIDLESSGEEKKLYDIIIVDAPCSGSGTWTNAPDVKESMNEKLLNSYQKRQLKILANARKALKSGGQLIYITCSVYTDENEHVSSMFATENKLSSLDEAYVKGYEYGGDTFYYNLFTK